MTTGKGLKLVERDADGVDLAFRADVLAGLAEPQKAVPARWFYDDAGSRLFEDITRLPEYYLTRAETEILRGRAEEDSSACSWAGQASRWLRLRCPGRLLTRGARTSREEPPPPPAP